ncbi:MAG: hypothetical protein MJ211_04055 [Bacteroidales bacterium]|nr:hypothetical protein [Bacteroidales bacterium]
MIEYIGRKTLNERGFIVNTLGKEEILKIYDLAEVYHCFQILLSLIFSIIKISFFQK